MKKINLSQFIQSISKLINFLKRNQKKSILFFCLVLLGVFLVVQPARADIGDAILKAMAGLFQGFTALALGGVTFCLEFFLNIAKYNGYVEPSTQIVVVGWTLVRDVANMFFVVILLVIAFGTILGVENYQWNKLLGKLIFAAIFINFSKMICGLFIDVAYVFSLTFLNAIVNTAQGNILHAFHMTKLLDFSNSSEVLNNTGISPVSLAVSNFAAFMFAVMLLFTMGAYLGIMLARMVVLWLLIILSPLAFIFQIMPQTQEYAKQWWSRFTKQVLVLPVMTFFLWLTLATSSSGDIANTIGVGFEGTLLETTSLPSSLVEITSFNNMANFLVPFAIMIAGLTIVGQMGVVGGGLASKALDLGKRVGAIASGYALGRKVAGGAVSGLVGGAKTVTKFGLKKMPVIGGDALARYGKTIKSGASFAWSKVSVARDKLAKNLESSSKERVKLQRDLRQATDPEKKAEIQKKIDELTASDTAFSSVGRFAKRFLALGVESSGRANKRAANFEDWARGQKEIEQSEYSLSDTLGGDLKTRKNAEVVIARSNQESKAKKKLDDEVAYLYRENQEEMDKLREDEKAAREALSDLKLPKEVREKKAEADKALKKAKEKEENLVQAVVKVEGEVKTAQEGLEQLGVGLDQDVVRHVVSLNDDVSLDLFQLYEKLNEEERKKVESLYRDSNEIASTTTINLNQVNVQKELGEIIRQLLGNEEIEGNVDFNLGLNKIFLEKLSENISIEEEPKEPEKPKLKEVKGGKKQRQRIQEENKKAKDEYERKLRTYEEQSEVFSEQNRRQRLREAMRERVSGEDTKAKEEDESADGLAERVKQNNENAQKAQQEGKLEEQQKKLEEQRKALEEAETALKKYQGEDLKGAMKEARKWSPLGVQERVEKIKKQLEDESLEDGEKRIKLEEEYALLTKTSGTSEQIAEAEARLGSIRASQSELVKKSFGLQTIYAREQARAAAESRAEAEAQALNIVQATDIGSSLLDALNKAEFGKKQAEEFAATLKNQKLSDAFSKATKQMENIYKKWEKTGEGNLDALENELKKASAKDAFIAAAIQSQKLEEAKSENTYTSKTLENLAGDLVRNVPRGGRLPTSAVAPILKEREAIFDGLERQDASLAAVKAVFSTVMKREKGEKISFEDQVTAMAAWMKIDREAWNDDFFDAMVQLVKKSKDPSSEISTQERAIAQSVEQFLNDSGAEIYKDKNGHWKTKGNYNREISSMLQNLASMGGDTSAVLAHNNISKEQLRRENSNKTKSVNEQESVDYWDIAKDLKVDVILEKSYAENQDYIQVAAKEFKKNALANGHEESGLNQEFDANKGMYRFNTFLEAQAGMLTEISKKSLAQRLQSQIHAWGDFDINTGLLEKLNQSMFSAFTKNLNDGFELRYMNARTLAKLFGYHESEDIDKSGGIVRFGGERMFKKFLEEYGTQNEARTAMTKHILKNLILPAVTGNAKAFGLMLENVFSLKREDVARGDINIELPGGIKVNGIDSLISKLEGLADIAPEQVKQLRRIGADWKRGEIIEPKRSNKRKDGDE